MSSADKPTKDVTELIGKFLLVQKMVFAGVLLVASVISWNSVAVAFLAPEVDHWCVKPDNESLASTDLEEIEDNGTLSCACDAWEYDHDVFASTLTEKLNLVCDSSLLISFGTSLYMLGGLVGSIAFGQLADKIGRRKTMLGLMVPTLGANILILLTTNYAMFAVGQFVSGAAGAAVFNAVFILMMETVGAEYRSVLGTSVEFSFSTGHLLLMISSWLLRHWFYLQLVIVICTALLGIFLWFLPESPSWLLVSDRVEEAELVVHWIAKKNGLEAPNLQERTRLLHQQIESTKQKPGTGNYNILDLLRTRNIRKWSLIVFFYTFTVGFIFFGISVNIGIFGSNLFLDFFLSTIVTYPSGLVCIFAMRFVARRKNLSAIMICTAVVCFSYLPATLGPEWLQISIVTLAKCLITPAFPVSNTYLAELYPTPIRSIGLGVGGLMARLGGTASPFIKEIGNMTDPRVPMTIFGLCSLLAGVSVFLLPETKDRRLPDTIEEREKPTNV